MQYVAIEDVKVVFLITTDDEDLDDRFEYLIDEANAEVDTILYPYAETTNSSRKSIVSAWVVNNELVQVEEHHKTTPNATPKLKALEILTNAQKLKMQLISGDTLNVSAALVGQRMVELENDVNRLEKIVPKSKTNVIKKLKATEEDNTTKQ